MRILKRIFVNFEEAVAGTALLLMTAFVFINTFGRIFFNKSFAALDELSYPYMDVQEMTWKRKKLLSLMAKMDNYSDYLLLWSPRDKKLWYLDIEHEEFHPLAKWEEFITDPGKYLNGMIEGEFEE